MIHRSNFSVGTTSPNFDRKLTATIGSPNFEKTIVSPWPHKNTSTLKIKYDQNTTFAKGNSHSKTMDINRMDLMTLAMTRRPKVLTHLKNSSIKFTGYNEI